MEDAGAELVDDALGVGGGVVVELVVPPHAATPARRAATPSAWKGRRIDKGVEEIVMTPHCNLDDETTMREQGEDGEAVPLLGVRAMRHSRSLICFRCSGVANSNSRE